MQEPPKGPVPGPHCPQKHRLLYTALFVIFGISWGFLVGSSGVTGYSASVQALTYGILNCLVGGEFPSPIETEKLPIGDGSRLLQTRIPGHHYLIRSNSATLAQGLPPTSESATNRMKRAVRGDSNVIFCSSPVFTRVPLAAGWPQSWPLSLR